MDFGTGMWKIAVYSKNNETSVVSGEEGLEISFISTPRSRESCANAAVALSGERFLLPQQLDTENQGRK